MKIFIVGLLKKAFVFLPLREKKSIFARENVMNIKSRIIMRRIFLFIAFFAAVLSASAQKSFDYNLWPNGAPGDNGITAEETTGEPWKNVKTARMTIYKSDRPGSKCIIMCPGGGYMSEWWVNEGTSFAPWMHNRHITYIVMKYRLPNGGHHEIPLLDVQEAIREVRAHAEEWNVDPHAVGIMGASAGGHLAASAATLFTSPENRPDFQVLLYPVILFDYAHGTRDNLLGKNPSEELIQRYSLEKQVTANTPRAFVVLAADDRTVPAEHSLKYCMALTAKKVSTMLLMYPYGDHGFGCQERFAFKYQWLNELEHWLGTF